MTFSFFLPPANAVSGRATMSAASTSRGERVTVLDATFAEEQLRSGNFIGTHDLPLDSLCRSLVGRFVVGHCLLSHGPFLCLVLFLRYSALPCLSILLSPFYFPTLQVSSPYPPCLLSYPDSSLIPHPSIQFTRISSISSIDSQWINSNLSRNE